MPEAQRARTAAVIGGGPAGLIAAEYLAGDGVAVTVYEHKPSVGRKLLLAGRGGLNLTHSEPLDSFTRRYDATGWVAPLLAEFGPDDLRAWCASLGEETFVGSSGRVFPVSFRATPLLRAWLRRLDDLGVQFATRHRWLGWDADGAHRFADADGAEIGVRPDVTVLALGGASWPRVGSDGGWVPLVESIGVGVTSLRPANAGFAVRWSDGFAERFAGQPLKNVSITAGRATVRGDAIVAATGLEGGPVYGVGRAVRTELERAGVATIAIDLHPDQTADQLAARLERRRPKDSVSTWLRRALGLDLVAINLLREGCGPALPDEPAAMAALVKHVPIAVDDLMPIDRAISTAGGISLDELDTDLMLRRRPGTFVAGEMIDWDAPTGGYLLQASFSTGVVAARAASKWSRGERDGSRSLTSDDG
ncbi:MAG: TIGR03862 family flavoprotein [Ilumatobacteraceae bacterium]|nr:TIGR03862 family flavoprotein [Ilumatobacteraceae bacterium]